jgi:hypothetical protein
MRAWRAGEGTHVRLMANMRRYLALANQTL